jgi:hypothetical protein
MPNHYTTRFIVLGEPKILTAFAVNHIVKDRSDDTESDIETFDFNTIILMPAEIKNTISGTESSSGLIALGREDLEEFPRSASDMLKLSWVKEAGITTVEGLRTYLAKEYPEGVEEAKRQIGSLNWYDWACKNWGTKWNSYLFSSMPFLENSSTRLEFQFCTAWSPPIFVIKKLIEMYPTLNFTIYGRDEFEDDEEVIFNDESGEAFWKCAVEAA